MIFHPHPDLKKIPDDFRTAWAAALRFSKKEREALYDPESSAMCCLGVACRVSGLSNEDMLTRKGGKRGLPSEITNVNLTDYTIMQLEKLDVAKNEMGRVYKFAGLNDGKDCPSLTHPEIADLLEFKTVEVPDD